jgi:hypothetical protein
MSVTVHLDAFQTNLHGAKILLQGPFTKGRLPPLVESLESLRSPFKRKVLLTNTPFSFNKMLPFAYDAVFQIKEGIDWSLALTYILHAPKDVLVVAEDIPIPDAVWAKLGPTITFLHTVITPLRSVQHYTAIFFAPIDDITSTYTDTVWKALTVCFKKTMSQKELRDILQELRIAKAGLAWTSVGEQGSLYWYDPEVLTEDPLSRKQLADLFQLLATQFT